MVRTLRIAHVTSELTPFAKTGGLADVSAALPAFLSEAGHDVRVFTPLHSVIDRSAHSFEKVEALTGLSLRLGVDRFSWSVVRAPLPETPLLVDFVDCPALYARPRIYTNAPDEHRRFILLQRAALEACQRLGWSPDVVHCHDWQASLIPLYLKTTHAWDDRFRATRTVLTIHNIAYQGRFPAEVLRDTGLEGGARWLHQRDLHDGFISFLTTGILYAERITTVSPTYAEEIRSEPLGAGLHELTRARGATLVGILNGVDTKAWNPRTDQHLPFRYSVKSLWRKQRDKEALLAELGLPHEPNAPLLGMVTRLVGQKGIELLIGPLPETLARSDLRVVVLGSGEPRFERFFAQLEASFPDRVRFRRGFDEQLAHRIEAGADMFLMPSLYEPCGLNQMYSLLYGTIPIVRKTGGLADTVQLWNPWTGQGNGVVFDHPTSDGVRWALQTALGLWRDRAAWKKLVRNAMSADFSWERAGRRYLELYEELARSTAEV